MCPKHDLQCGVFHPFHNNTEEAAFFTSRLANMKVLVWDGTTPVPHVRKHMHGSTTASSARRTTLQLGRADSRSNQHDAARGHEQTSASQAHARSTQPALALAGPRLFSVPYSTAVHFVPSKLPSAMSAVVQRPVRAWAPEQLHAHRRPLLAAYIGAFRRGTDPTSAYWAVKMAVRSSALCFHFGCT